MYRYLSRLPILLLAVFLLLGGAASATHLVGGSIAYEYLGRTGNIDKYRIYLDIFRDGNSTTPFDPTVHIGVYDKVTGRAVDPDHFLASQNVPVKFVDPVDGGSDCDFKPNAKTEQQLYIFDIEVPASNIGYDVIHIRCCRNDLTNLPEFEGMTFYASISPSEYKNSSPRFNDVPLPYICARDTAYLLNNASEKDGDSLMYSLFQPYHGADDKEPKPDPPGFYPNERKVRYSTGYSASKPFGTTSSITVDPGTGLTTIYAASAGLYAIAIKVEEYRDKKLISTTIRDLQVIVLNCPVNPPPRRQSNASTGVKNFFSVDAGTTVTYSFDFVDDNDIVSVELSGSAFEAGVPAPRPTVTSTPVGKGTSTITLTWDTKCSHIRPEPYTLNITLKDNGCPAKKVTTVIQVQVKKPVTPDKILGRDSVCGAGIFEYSVNNENNYKLEWTVQGGTIVELLDNNQKVRVDWDEQTTGKLILNGTTPAGCKFDALEQTVVILPKPPKPAASIPQLVCIRKPFQASMTSQPNATYAWFAEGPIKIVGTSKAATINLEGTDTGTAFVKGVIYNKFGCPSDSIISKVIVDAASADTIYGSLSVCPNSQGVTYAANGRASSSFSWAVKGGTISFTAPKGKYIEVNWGEKGEGIVQAVETTGAGCLGDTVTALVTIDYTLITPPIEGDTVACAYTNGLRYGVPVTNGSTYTWTISGGDIVAGNGTDSITVNWQDAGSGLLQVQEFAFDPVNNRNCIGIPVTLAIRIAPLPEADTIRAPDVLCEESVILLYINGLSTSTFIWTFSDSVYFTGQGNDSVFATFYGDSNFVVTVQEVTVDSCFGPINQQTLFINPKPRPQAIDGPELVCVKQLRSNTYSTTGLPGSIFLWEVNGGSIATGDSSNTIIVDWEEHGTGLVKVVELAASGCGSDTLMLDVVVDSPALDIVVVTTLRENDEVIKVTWELKNGNNQKEAYTLYRSDLDGTGAPIATIQPGVDSFIDRNVSTSNRSYTYWISYQDICGNTITSRRHTSILLAAELEQDTIINLEWNRYNAWPRVDKYQLYRQIDDDTTFRRLQSFSTTNATYNVGLEGWKQCYRIRAVYIRKPGDTLVSWSNKQCFTFRPIVYIPNAFTPNFDPENPLFRVTAAHYRSFVLSIYNRWGERMFESEHPSKMWDGTFQGRPCQDDTYLYMVRVKGYQENIFKKGTLHLLR